MLTTCAGSARAEDRLLVDETPQPTISVSQVRLHQARLRLVGHPPDYLACNCCHASHSDMHPADDLTERAGKAVEQPLDLRESQTLIPARRLLHAASSAQIRDLTVTGHR